MKKKEINKDKLSVYSEYLESGMIEVGKEQNLNVEVTNIIKTKQGKMPASVFVLQSFADKMSMRENYSVIVYRVLFHLISLSRYENFVSIDVKTISENLNISERSVKRATSQLYNDNIIVKVEHLTDKRRRDYFMNPMATWKGKTLNRDKALKKLKDGRIQLDMFNENIKVLKAI
jgi:DNA-binding MarR family transcriptional regulator